MNELVTRLLSRFNRDNRGVSAIEFAIVLPILVILLMGIIEFGWYLNGYITITGAAREGVRAAVLDEEYELAVDQHVNHSISPVTVNSYSLNPENPNKSNFGDEMTLSLTGDLSTLVSYFDWLSEDGNYSLAAEATMRYMGTTHGKPVGNGTDTGSDNGNGSGSDNDNETGEDSAPSLNHFSGEGDESTLTISFDKNVETISFEGVNLAHTINDNEVTFVFDDSLRNNTTMTIHVTGFEGETTNTYDFYFQNHEQGWSSS